MADVARLAGVGKMTVSRLLSGSAGVSKKTADKIHRAIGILKYQPNEVARSLRALNSNTIGVIVPYLYDPFFATCAHAISTVAKQHGFSVILTTSDEEPETESRQINLMLRRKVDGILMIPATGKGKYRSEQEFSRVHIVTIDRPAIGSRFDSVLVNNRAGTRSAVEHLIGHGHRNIVFIGLSHELFTMKARYAGYKEAMIEARLTPASYHDCETQEHALTLLRSMLGAKNPPTAIFTGNNLSMRYVMHALNAAGVDIPGQLALAGFDDFDMADVLHPALTVVRQPIYEIGEVAANRLFQLIAQGEFPKAGRRIVLPLELVIRRSCGCNTRTANSQPRPAKKHAVHSSRPE